MNISEDNPTFPVIHLNGTYKFVRFQFYGDLMFNHFGNFLFYLFSISGNDILSALSQKNIDWETEEGWTLKNKLVQKLMEYQQQVYAMMSTRRDKTHSLFYIYPNSNKSKDELDSQFEDECLLSLKYLQVHNPSWFKDQTSITSDEQGENYTKIYGYCIKVVESYLKNWTVTDTYIFDMDYNFNLSDMGSEAGIFQNSQQKSSDELFRIQSGIAGGNNPINKIFSENLPLEISLSNLLRNSNLDLNNIELGGLPPGTYFIATCRQDITNEPEVVSLRRNISGSRDIYSNFAETGSDSKTFEAKKELTKRQLDFGIDITQLPVTQILTLPFNKMNLRTIFINMIRNINMNSNLNTNQICKLFILFLRRDPIYDESIISIPFLLNKILNARGVTKGISLINIPKILNKVPKKSSQDIGVLPLMKQKIGLEIADGQKVLDQNILQFLPKLCSSLLDIDCQGTTNRDGETRPTVFTNLRMNQINEIVNYINLPEWYKFNKYYIKN